MALPKNYLTNSNRYRIKTQGVIIEVYCRRTIFGRKIEKILSVISRPITRGIIITLDDSNSNTDKIFFAAFSLITEIQVGKC